MIAISLDLKINLETFFYNLTPHFTPLYLDQKLILLFDTGDGVNTGIEHLKANFAAAKE